MYILYVVLAENRLSFSITEEREGVEFPLATTKALEFYGCRPEEQHWSIKTPHDLQGFGSYIIKKYRPISKIVNGSFFLKSCQPEMGDFYEQRNISRGVLCQDELEFLQRGLQGR